TLVSTGAVAGVMYAFGAPAPVNVIAIALAIGTGIVVFALLALATTTITKNAEAAQITSLPVFVLAVAGMASIRDILPDNLARIADWTPFAAVSDLIHLGTSGLRFDAADAATPLRFGEVFGEIGQPVATMALWTALALWMIVRSFRWDDRG
ncbi:MAG: ABC transporter permease, partial [Gordonia amarae]